MFAGKTVCCHLSALENAIVFKGALQMSRFTLLFQRLVERKASGLYNKHSLLAELM